ncbi:MAG: UDP-N-acetylmuramoyl-L-alanine--D-glutamate ligase [Candidatus Omnitrophota bacterium]|jgi:UDP-N-acetylmuramoylalanine--D-glutamate ligase|nr:UDP-N-acetylmuramoyl-L-alanine--D-glutamate ligase [Candidatus Omnitrophota bacterium]
MSLKAKRKIKNVTVIGLGKSGVSTARLLAAQGNDVFITDSRADEDISLSAETLLKEGVLKRENLEIGRHTQGFISNADLVVVSPGVRGDSLPIKWAEEQNIPVISELELAFTMCTASVIAVTGTSGKTTVTTLIGEMLTRSGRDVVTCGNIGTPFTGEIKRITPSSIVVVEVSSFQLERIKTFKPKVSVILNISENHLDRHKDMEEYTSCKKKIYSNQDEFDTLFLNSSDKVLKDISRGIKKVKVEFFNEYKNFSKRFNINNEDYLAAVSVAASQGASEQDMRDALSEFRGIEHRLEYVDSVNGVDFINDSKATTVASVEWALKSLGGKIILILGGKYKGGDFSRLGPYINEKVDSIIAIGEARGIITEQLKDFQRVKEKDSLKQAVQLAFDEASKGSKIVLSPGCSSFDMFKNYEERGKCFKELCLEFKTGTLKRAL